MKETFIIFVISFSFFTLTACNNPLSKIQPITTFTIAQCQALFQKTAELFEKADAEKVYFDPNIADALLEASEMFLNNCTDPSDSRYGAFLSRSTFHNQDGKAKDETPG